jgi:hypothetical protein
VISPTAPKPTSVAKAFTDGSQNWGGDAEATSASTFDGINRMTVPADRRTYATVPGVQSSEKPRDVTVEPRTRSINDRPEGPKMGTGNDIEFILVNVSSRRAGPGVLCVEDEWLAAHAQDPSALNLRHVFTTIPALAYVCTSRRALHVVCSHAGHAGALKPRTCAQYVTANSRVPRQNA